MDAKKSKLILAYAGLTLAIFFWSINTVLARGIVFSIKPLALSFFRWIFAFFFILPFAVSHIKRDLPVIKENLKFLVILSIFSVAIYNSVLYIGAQYTTATNISLVIATMPGITILFAWLINKEIPAFFQMAGIGVSLIGMVIIICQGSVSLLMDLTFNPGDLLIVLSISSWALYSVLLRKRQIDISPISFLTMIIAIGIVLIFPFYLWEFFRFKGFALTMTNLGVFIYLGLFPSILSYICWNFGVKIAGSSQASVFMYLTPVFTSILACVFLNESLFSYHIVGGILIFAGLVMSSRS
ncbi:MAG: DMT family transporter [Desulfobacteraceae bacterium]|nr:DMT family transporter [Desulfobacteraceae bacterium]